MLWRLERGWTQKALAKAVSLPQPNISDIERGKQDVSLKTIRALALALGVKPGMLVDGVPPQNPGTGEEYSRESLERIADAAVYGTRLKTDGEAALAKSLKFLLNSRLRAAGLKKGAKNIISRKSDRTWLRLSQYPNAVVKSLLHRASDRMNLP